MIDILKNFAPRAVQDLITAFAALLAAHGYITPGAQEQQFIGAAFFIVMMIVNYLIGQSRKADAAHAGANLVGASISTAEASAIAKGKTP